MSAGAEGQLARLAAGRLNIKRRRWPAGIGRADFWHPRSKDQISVREATSGLSRRRASNSAFEDARPPNLPDKSAIRRRRRLCRQRKRAGRRRKQPDYRRQPDLQKALARARNPAAPPSARRGCRADNANQGDPMPERGGGCGRLRQNQRAGWHGLAAAGGGQQDKPGSKGGNLKMAGPVHVFFRSPGSRTLRIWSTLTLVSSWTCLLGHWISMRSTPLPCPSRSAGGGRFA